MIGTLLAGRYRVTGLLGGGGMAVVYKATDEVTGETVAVKALRSEFVSDAAFLRRLRREAEAVRRLSHPGVVAVRDVGEDAGQPFLVLEYVEGITLKQHIREKAPLPLREAVHIACRVLAVLEHAHQHGVIHRDVKPQNILMTADGRVMVTDFGIARASGTTTTVVDQGAMVGTAQYFAPEQARGMPASERSDLYAVGIILFEMLTGRLPFDGDTPVAVAMQHLGQEPPLPSALNPAVPRALEAIVLKALEKNPDRRYPSAAAMRHDLENFLAGRPVAALARPAVEDTLVAGSRPIPSLEPVPDGRTGAGGGGGAAPAGAAGAAGSLADGVAAAGAAAAAGAWGPGTGMPHPAVGAGTEDPAGRAAAAANGRTVPWGGGPGDGAAVDRGAGGVAGREAARPRVGADGRPGRQAGLEGHSEGRVRTDGPPGEQAAWAARAPDGAARPSARATAAPVAAGAVHPASGGGPAVAGVDTAAGKQPLPAGDEPLVAGGEARAAGGGAWPVAARSGRRRGGGSRAGVAADGHGLPGAARRPGGRPPARPAGAGAGRAGAAPAPAPPARAAGRGDGVPAPAAEADPAARAVPVPAAAGPGARRRRVLRVALAVFLLLVLAMGAGAAARRWLQPPVVIVPSVEGLPLIEAQNRLEQAGLQWEILEERYDNSEVNTVIEQRPAGGEQVRMGQTVQLVVSRGPRWLSVPDVRGLGERDARLRLENAGFVVEVRYAYADEAEGVVVDQDPGPGSPIQAGMTVYLTVSQGPERRPVIVPSLFGLSVADARAELQAAGLVAGTVEERSSPYPAGTVIGQDPAAAATVERGTRVNLVVSQGPDPAPSSGGTGETRQATLTINLQGSGQHALRVEVQDDAGRRVVYDQTVQGGQKVEVPVTWQGDGARALIYVDGQLVDQRDLKAPGGKAKERGGAGPPAPDGTGGGDGAGGGDGQGD
ncbi:serine/threonine protein kinase with PASTA sensor(s) [Thermaerobacter marianensis DSM 12885]|uniref:non-specific serine/threonine protein kinase n=1 Tax=Thermaerobacter marianensis (strain ATCC 700841 / DSM 12885 / JCM 10246 / 7p75a) TaxID=644966 RepID=E6SJA9_THEM7|nr:PASTA domain-containing protein [Thermaerobacter marianensis]ADU51037.1 serine/threonine protein kinase with PASTA sensor(s) [Thermaerobacter marianensis DSM 12885]